MRTAVAAVASERGLHGSDAVRERATLAVPAMPQPAEGEAGIRVGVLLAASELSGPARQLVTTARALRDHGVETRVAVLSRREPRANLLDAFTACSVPFEWIRDGGPLDFSLVGRVRERFAAWNATLVQTHGYKATALTLVLRAMGLRLPWVGFFHGETVETARARLYHTLDRRMLRSADRIVVMSRAQHERLGKLTKARIIYNAVNPPPQSAGAAPDLRGLPRPLLGVIGRLSPEKGVDLFLEALALLGDRDFVAGGAILGDGPERTRLEAQVARLGLEDRVRFFGTVPDPTPWYHALDLVVLPSRSEGLPNVLLEALAADRRVIATNVGAVADVLRLPGAGTIIDPGSPQRLADAIRSVLLAGDSAAAQAARRATAEAFSLERRAEQLAALYTEVAKR